MRQFSPKFSAFENFTSNRAESQNAVPKIYLRSILQDSSKTLRIRPDTLMAHMDHIIERHRYEYSVTNGNNYLRKGNVYIEQKDCICSEIYVWAFLKTAISPFIFELISNNK